MASVLRQSRLSSAKTRRQNKETAVSKSQNIASDYHHQILLNEGHLKDYRIQEPSVLNSLKNSINKTFAVNKNPVYHEIKQLTDPQVQPSHQKYLHRIFLKYSIAVNPNRVKMAIPNVDVDFIAKQYVKSRSQDKKRQESKRRLTKDVQSFYYVNEKKNQIPFFSIESDRIRELEKRARSKSFQDRQESKQDKKSQTFTTFATRSNTNDFISGLNSKERIASSRKTARPRTRSSMTHYKHPYMSLYDQVQKQTFSSFASGKKLNLDVETPDLDQPQEWQADQKKIKGIYVGVKKMRQIHSAKQRKKTNSGKETSTFYIT